MGAVSADDYEMVLEHHMARLEMDVEPTEEEDERHQLEAKDSDAGLDPDMDVSKYMPIW